MIESVQNTLFDNTIELVQSIPSDDSMTETVQNAYFDDNTVKLV